MVRSDNLRSIFAMLLAVAFFSVMDAVMKLLVVRYPALQVTALRGLSALPLVLAYVAWSGARASLWRVRWPLHLVRGMLSIAMLALFAFGLQTLPLAESYTLFFVAPLLITLLSIPVLKERVAGAHWWAIAAGFAGVVVALKPTGSNFLTLGALAVLGAAGCYAVSAVVGRLLTRTDSSASLVFWTTIALAVGGGLLALPGWRPVDRADLPLIAGLALMGFAGQVSITEAFRRGQASVVAPFEYTALAWGVGIDWWLWSSLPQPQTLVGAAIIVASGIYLVRHERVRVAVLPP